MENKALNRMDTSKSIKSNTGSRRKSEVSPNIIICSIERDLIELLQEITIRAQKDKLNSALGIIKYINTVRKSKTIKQKTGFN
jgi:hypothetical protein